MRDSAYILHYALWMSEVSKIHSCFNAWPVCTVFLCTSNLQLLYWCFCLTWSILWWLLSNSDNIIEIGSKFIFESKDWVQHISSASNRKIRHSSLKSRSISIFIVGLMSNLLPNMLLDFQIREKYPPEMQTDLIVLSLFLFILTELLIGSKMSKLFFIKKRPCNPPPHLPRGVPANL